MTKKTFTAGHVVFPVEELVRGITGGLEFINNRRHDLLEILGIRLLSEAVDAFQEKSRGGTGSDGIKWAPLKPATIARKNRRGKRNAKRKTTKGGKKRPGAGSSQIGVDTGLMRASGQPGYAGNTQVGSTSVTVGYAMEYSHWFDETRKLLPEKMPDAWQKALDDSAQRFIDKHLKGELV